MVGGERKGGGADFPKDKQGVGYSHNDTGGAGGLAGSAHRRRSALRSAGVQCNVRVHGTGLSGGVIDLCPEGGL